MNNKSCAMQDLFLLNTFLGKYLPYFCSLLQISDLLYDHIMHLTTSIMRMIIDTATVLLVAGSNTEGPAKMQPLDHLLGFIQAASKNNINANEYLDHGNDGEIVYEDLFPILNELLELLLAHGAYVKYRGAFVAHEEDLLTGLILYAKILSIDNQKINDTNSHTPGSLKAFNNSMDGIANMIRNFLLVGAAMSFYSGFDTDYAFAVIAGYSSQPGRTQRIVNAVLSLLNANEVTELKGSLSLGRVSSSILPKAFIAAGLVFLNLVKIPLPLKHITRGSVNRALSRRGQLGTFNLPIPESLKQYIRHHEIEFVYTAKIIWFT